jgi:hypothetical protein
VGEPEEQELDDIDDEDEDDEDEDDDEEEAPEEEESEEEEDEAPFFRTQNTDPTLLAFLDALLVDPQVALVLTDWLTERGDERAETVRELATAHAVIPDGGITWGEAPMGCGASWKIVRHGSSVFASAYSGTPLHRTLRSLGREGAIRVQVPRQRQTPERLAAAFDRCRLELQLGLFGKSRGHMNARRLLLHERNLDRVAKALRRCGKEIVPSLCELRGTDPDRFDQVLTLIWGNEALHALGYGVLDVVDPGWRGRLPALTATNGGPSPTTARR